MIRALVMRRTRTADPSRVVAAAERATRLARLSDVPTSVTMQSVSSSSTCVARSRFGRSAGLSGPARGTDTWPLEGFVPDLYLILLIFFAMVAIIALTALAIDRSGREKAWREVAADSQESAAGRVVFRA